MSRSFLLLLFIFLAVGTVNAESSKLSLKDAISMALEKNNLVKAAGFNADSAQHRVAMAESGYYPTLFFDESFAATNIPTQTFMMKLDQGRFTNDDFQINNLNHPSTHNDFKTSLTLQQPLYTPSTGPSRAMAVKDAEKGALGVEAAKQEIAFQVFGLYLEIRKATAQLTAAEKAVSEARENLRLATVRSAEGVGLRSDELRGRTHLALVEQQLITARNNLTLAQMRLAIVVGLKPGSAVDITGDSTSFIVKDSLADLTQTALESRTELRQSSAEFEKADAAVKLAQSSFLPSADAFASYQLNARDTPFNSDNDAWMAGVSLKWQLFDGFRRYHDFGSAKASRSAVAEAKENASREIAFQVQESFLREQEMSKRMEVAKHALADAEETVRLISRRFENSLATMVELLDAQTALNLARANLVDTEANHALAGGRVYYSAGIFLKEIQK